MLHAGDGPRRNARTILQPLRRDARQRRAAYLISRALPRLPRHAQHRALAGPGVTHEDAQTPAIGRMVERCALLARQRQPARLRAGQSVSRAFSSVRRSEEHTSELQSLMRISYAVFCLKKKKHT